jgi:hypothetical protein
LTETSQPGLGRSAAAVWSSDAPRIAIEIIAHKESVRLAQVVRKANDIHLSLAAAQAAVLAGVLRCC